jgi:NADH-quinone oxidoreductase subunit E
MSDSDLLSDHAREEIDQWKARFPEDRQRSAVIGALHVVQHENNGYLTAELMNAVADYLDLPTIQVYEVATFYSMFQTRPVGRHKALTTSSITSRRN